MNMGVNVNSVLYFMHPQPHTNWLPVFEVLFWLLSLGVRAGRAHDAVLPQEVPQDLILGLPVFHLRRRTP